MTVLAVMRHGQSRWNLDNRFTGWWDSDLTPAGEAEARQGGALLAASGIEFDQAWTSVQTRAIRTLWLALQEMDRSWLPVRKDYRLNERHYGALTGLNKRETMAAHGEEQVRIWRRSYATPPPLLEPLSRYDVSADKRYRGVKVPAAESLKDTLMFRVQPLWQEELALQLEQGRSLLISAHGNSLRALAKLIFAISDQDITSMEIPTGVPMIIEMDKKLQPRSAVYLDPARGTAPLCPGAK